MQTNNGGIRRLATRSESMAYARQSSLRSRLSYWVRNHTRSLAIVVALGLFLIVISTDSMERIHTSPGKFLRKSGASSMTFNEHWGGAIRAGYFIPSEAIESIPNNGSTTSTQSNNSPQKFHFGAVTDLDQLSRVADASKPTFRSILLSGVLQRTATNKYEISFDPSPRTLVTGHNEAGRGAEFSELTLFQDRLLTFDDRTGDVFEILNTADGSDSFVVPRFVITEGSGETDKGMKWEWATVKNDELYMGSMGKAYTRPDGSIVNRHNLWIAVLNSRGEMRRENWSSQYDVVRKALGAMDPGYLIIEAVNWSEALRKWIFLPRRISSDAYDENLDEKKGGNKLVIVDENFSKATVVEIKLESPRDMLRGFSTFAFVPGTGDRHAIAIRSVEEDCVGGVDQVCKQRSYFTVFDVLSGDVLCDEVKYDQDVKFEGIEFVNLYTIPTQKL